MPDQVTTATAPEDTVELPNADWIRTRYMKNQRDEQLLDVLEEALNFPRDANQRATPARFGRHKETRGIIVTAPSGEGKTTLLDRNLAELPGLGFYDGHAGNVLMVTVNPDATLKGLAISILSETGYDVDPTKIQVAPAWEMVSHRMNMLGTSVLWIDEAHHLLTSGPGRDAATALRRLKSMLQGEHAIVVVLSGISKLAELLGRDEETNRRFFKLSLGPVRTTGERAKLERFIQALIHHSGIEPVDDPQFSDRLLAASNGSLGNAIDLVARCISRATDKGDACLELRHFRRAHRLNGWAGTIGPFDDEPWDALKLVLEEYEGKAA
ncbi:Predicted ATPase [Loktanella sp. DSM 29012]|uniref:ATP-binding protein n=1 Tax=Loktanella sp. DSM 29012 TaxID=1881056 RepID=UPI0008D1261C|nr:ATP-binding protein [Loktanella sp. DSM 29012]SEQ86635.1 Predicted ATPase [Loktanella sp. DSM 29012]